MFLVAVFHAGCAVRKLLCGIITDKPKEQLKHVQCPFTANATPNESLDGVTHPQQMFCRKATGVTCG
ncbi:hypothetical protein CGMCC3_g18111 [Colletotrichum fructicola]|nr:uncharacterized protein CGMCC3_g18111 [Colletotrichum fructicola]KAE9565704.1 hypothetical protein CGMCC3_g18111 [Colletotrichum fructicola]